MMLSQKATELSEKKVKGLRLLSFLGLAVSLLCLALGWLSRQGFVIPQWLMRILYSNTEIIGGADGPTAIFVTGEANPFAAAGLFCLTLFSAFGIYCTDRKN